MNKRFARTTVALAAAGGILFSGSAAFAGGGFDVAKEKGPKLEDARVDIDIDDIKKLPSEVETPGKLPPKGDKIDPTGKLPELDPCIQIVIKHNPKIGDLIKKKGYVSSDILDDIAKVKDQIKDKLPKDCPPPKTPPKQDPPPETETDTPPTTEPTHHDTVEHVHVAPVVYYSSPTFTG